MVLERGRMPELCKAQAVAAVLLSTSENFTPSEAGMLVASTYKVAFPGLIRVVDMDSTMCRAVPCFASYGDTCSGSGHSQATDSRGQKGGRSTSQCVGSGPIGGAWAQQKPFAFPGCLARR